MYEAFYRFREKPFSILPDPGFLYLSSKHSTALALLDYGLMNQAGFNVITGEIGTGKTTLIRYMLTQMDRDVTIGLISNTHRSFGELQQWILFAFNLDYRGKGKVEMFQTFLDFLVKEYSENRRTVLIVDEAQNMSSETLEELRMLSNINADKDQLLQVILVGQAGLRDLLRQPDLRQFAQRIAVDYHLDPLDRHETHAYIRHRIAVAGGNDAQLFDDAACDAVYKHSQGVPRLINLLCDTALVYGFGAQKPRIGAPIVEEVAADKTQGGLFPSAARAAAEPPAAMPQAAVLALDSIAARNRDYPAGLAADNDEAHAAGAAVDSSMRVQSLPAQGSEREFMNYLKSAHAELYTNLRSAMRSFAKRRG